MNDFQKIMERETNENTARIMMMSIMSEKLSTIVELLKENNSTFEKIEELILEVKKAKRETNKETKVSTICILTPEDYME